MLDEDNLKLSVLLPVSRLEYLSDCLKSLVTALQNIECEIIVVNTLPLNIDSLLERYDARINVVNSFNSDYGRAVEIALNNSSGEFIALMNDDDLVSKYRFVDQLQKIAALKADYSICKFKYSGEFKLSFNLLPPLTSYRIEWLLLGPYGANATLLAKRQWFSAGIRNHIEGPSWDWNFALAHYHQGVCAPIAKKHYIYRIHNNQITGEPWFKRDRLNNLYNPWLELSNKYGLPTCGRQAFLLIVSPQDYLNKRIKVSEYSAYQVLREFSQWNAALAKHLRAQRISFLEWMWFSYHIAARYAILVFPWRLLGKQKNK